MLLMLREDERRPERLGVVLTRRLVGVRQGGMVVVERMDDGRLDPAGRPPASAPPPPRLRRSHHRAGRPKSSWKQTWGPTARVS